MHLIHLRLELKDLSLNTELHFLKHTCCVVYAVYCSMYSCKLNHTLLFVGLKWLYCASENVVYLSCIKSTIKSQWAIHAE